MKKFTVLLFENEHAKITYSRSHLTGEQNAEAGRFDGWSAG